MGHKGPALRPRCTGPVMVQTQITFNSNSTVAPQPDWLEKQVRPQQMCDTRVDITGTAQ